MIDYSKLARLELDLVQKQSALRGIESVRQDARDDLVRLESALGASEFRSQSAVELAAVRIDHGLASDPHPRGIPEARRRAELDLARQALAARARLADLQRRCDALAVEVTPLAKLVNNCRAHAIGSN